MKFFDYEAQSSVDNSYSRLTVLQDLSEEEWQMLVRCGQSISFKQGELLLQEGESDDAVYIVVSGQVEVVSSNAFGFVKRITLIDEGSVFGEVSFFDACPRSASIRGVSNGQVLRLSHKAFDRISAWNPRLAQLFLLDLGKILALRFRSGTAFKV